MAVSVDRWIARLKAVEPHERQELLAELSRVELEAVVLVLCQLVGEKQFVAEAALRAFQKQREDNNEATVKHNKLGNCWKAKAAVKRCAECGMDQCDVCHQHDEPRGDCWGCPECQRCNEDSAK